MAIIMRIKWDKYIQENKKFLQPAYLLFHSEKRSVYESSDPILAESEVVARTRADWMQLEKKVKASYVKRAMEAMRIGGHGNVIKLRARNENVILTNSSSPIKLVDPRKNVPDGSCYAVKVEPTSVKVSQVASSVEVTVQRIITVPTGYEQIQQQQQQVARDPQTGKVAPVLLVMNDDRYRETVNQMLAKLQSLSTVAYQKCLAHLHHQFEQPLRIDQTSVSKLRSCLSLRLATLKTINDYILNATEETVKRQTIEAIKSDLLTAEFADAGQCPLCYFPQEHDVNILPVVENKDIEDELLNMLPSSPFPVLNECDLVPVVSDV